MRLTYSGIRFQAYCGTFDGQALKKAGFHWDFRQHCWWTTRNDIANRFLAVADDKAKAKLCNHILRIRASKASEPTIDTSLTIPAPEGLDYLPFQKAGVSYAATRPNVLIADDMGLGKTIQACGIINLDTSLRNILIICPATLRINWARELQKWLTRRLTGGFAISQFIDSTNIVITNYDIVAKIRPYLDRRKWDLLICDECFTYDALVMTRLGLLQIGFIVEHEILTDALSYNTITKEIEWKPITGFLKKERKIPLVKVRYDDCRELICTANHPIWTGKSYTNASSLTSSDHIYLSRMQELWVRDQERRPQNDLLLTPLQRTFSYKDRLDLAKRVYQEDASGRTSYVYGTAEQAFRADEELKSDVESDDKTQNAGDNEEDLQNCHTCTNNAGEVDWSVSGTPDSNISCSRAISWNTRILSSRPSPSTNENFDRSRWPYTSVKSAKSSGQKTNGSLERVRVDSVTVLEQGNNTESAGSSEQNKYVYCLEIGENHNFFANGVLVSNCHMLKNPFAKRTIAVLGEDGKKATQLPIAARRKIFLTGTPILNRPAELWPIVRVGDPDGLGVDKDAYMERYCQAWDSPWGYDTSGANNLEELNERLRSTFMIRRKKEDVLKDLPAKRRQIILLPPDKNIGIIQAELQFYEKHTQTVERARAEAELSQSAGDQTSYESAAGLMKSSVKVLFEEMAKLRHDTAVAKIPYLISHLQNVLLQEEKIVFFAHHHDVMDAIAGHFGNMCVKFDGRNPNMRQNSIDRFVKDPSCRIFDGSITAAGIGIDGLQKVCRYALFGELDWRPAMITQAEDRLWRIGQLNALLIQHMVFDDSLDSKMVVDVIKKQDIITRALD